MATAALARSCVMRSWALRMFSRLAAVSAWLLLGAITAVTLGPISLRPETGHVVLERFLAFVALGTAFGLGYPRRLYFAAVVTLVGAVGLEVGQLLVPGRHARLIDAGEKLAGGMVGLAIAAASLFIATRLRARFHRWPD